MPFTHSDLSFNDINEIKSNAETTFNLNEFKPQRSWSKRK